jgi:hypothetical protein
MAAKAKDCLRLQPAAVSTVHWHEVVFCQQWREWDTSSLHLIVNRRHMSVESHRTTN